MLRKILLFTFIFTILTQAEEVKTKSIVCEPSLIYKCTSDSCEQFQVVNIDEIQFFEIDIEKNTLTGKVGNSKLDIENIVSRHGNENTFVFFGTHADSKFDWVLRIDKKTKAMIMLGSNEALDGFTVYGTCKWEAGK